MDKKTVLVTGNMGYIGSVMVPLLAEKGYDVIGYDVGYYEDCDLVDNTQPIVKQIKKDLRDVAVEDFAGVDYVIHLAGLSNDPLGEFGYGLTYSKVICTELEINGDMAVVTVENAGSFDTEDVVQLYISAPAENAPLRSLCGFSRVKLSAGEKQAVNIPLDKNAFTVVTDKGERITPHGKFTLYAGTSQPDELSENLTDLKCIKIEIEK